jgi:hypothetical protein
MGGCGDRFLFKVIVVIVVIVVVVAAVVVRCAVMCRAALFLPPLEPSSL